MNKDTKLTRKEKIQALYIKLCNDEGWIVKYREDPDRMLESCGIDTLDREYLKKILEMF